MTDGQPVYDDGQPVYDEVGGGGKVGEPDTFQLKGNGQAYADCYATSNMERVIHSITDCVYLTNLYQQFCWIITIVMNIF